MKIDWSLIQPVMRLDCPYADELKAVIQLAQSDEKPQPFPSQFLSAEKGDSWGEEISCIFQQWRANSATAPKSWEIITPAIEYFQIDPDHALIPLVITASALAEIKNTNPYHNNDHFREVVCFIVKLCAVHQDLDASRHQRLSDEDILILLTAACIHDFAHDGQSNIIDGVHIPSRLEKKAVDKSKPFFEALGVDDQILNKVERLVLSTDVSRGHNGRSPAGITRDIFLAHEHDNVSIVNAPEAYSLLLGSHQLSLMSMMLCEADIGISSSLTYDFAKDMTCLIASESSVLKPSAKTLYGFMDIICHGGFLTAAAQYLLEDNFNLIYAQAESESTENVLYA